MTTVLSPTAEAEAMRAALIENGYRDIAAHPTREGLRVGARVYHRGHQWIRAWNGTGTVLAMLRNEGSFWERKYGGPDIELVVLYDDDGREGTRTLDGRPHGLADYHVSVAEPER